MKARRIFSLMIEMVFLGMMFATTTTVKGADLDVGDKISESDIDTTGNQWYLFNSNCYIRTKPAFISYIPQILDADRSTGLDHDFGSSASPFMVLVEFPYDFLVKNITVDPVFNGHYTKCNFGISTRTSGGYLGYDIISETNFKINGIISGFYIQFNPGSETHLYFNDVIVEYEPRPSNVEDLFTAFNDLSGQFDALKAQIGDIPAQLSQIKNDIELIKGNISSIESDLAGVHEEIIDIEGSIDDLTNWIEDLEALIGSLNSTLTGSLEILKANISVIDDQIDQLLLDLEDVSANEKNISEIMNEISLLEGWINDTVNRFDLVEGNISDIRKDMPEPFDDSLLTARILSLENENIELLSMVQNLEYEIDKIKASEPDEQEKESGSIFIGIGIGATGVIIALIAVFIRFLRKDGERSGKNGTTEEDKIEEDMTIGNLDPEISNEGPGGRME